MPLNHAELARRLLREVGLRRTNQRVQLVTCLAAMPRHFGAEEALVALSVFPRRPVSRATLYRLLGELERHGILRRVLLSEGHSHYEFVGERERHSHVVCTGCGHVEEIHSTELDQALQRLGQEHGFTPAQAGVEINVAACSECEP
jgi:Fur family ferric uptake transcriptional regulator